MTDELIKIRNVNLQKQGKVILESINWTVERGSHWALMGSNGSGKTSLIKIITGYDWPSSGTVEVLNSRFGKCDITGVRKVIGLVSSAINPELPKYDSAIDIVLSGLDSSLGLYREFSKSEVATAAEAMNKLKVSQLDSKPFKLLSQGEQQRVLIARALVNKPSLLILDEPCAGLDPGSRESFLKDLHFMTDQPGSPAVIFITHHIEEICPWITHLLLLKGGKILAMGAVNETVTEDLISETFDIKCRLTRDSNRYLMKVAD